MENKKILSSWKEISNYLGIRVRTAQRWEAELGLPIHRIDELNKTYVIAYANELDEWLQKKTRKKTPKKTSNWKFIVGLIFGIMVILTIFVVLKDRKKAEISSFELADSFLVIYDSNGQRQWDFDLGPRLSEHEYSDEWASENVIIEDIDADGRPNVIVAIQNKDHLDEKLICLDSDGNQLWKFKVGREILYGDKTISPDFNINNIRVEDLDGNLRSEIMVVANHKIYFPSHFVILNYEGEVIGDYWNSGHFTNMIFFDLDDDNKKEIVLGGVNNNYRKSCIAVFDHLNVKGSSPQEKGTKYYSPELESGTEKYYLLLPQNIVGQSMYIQENIKAIDLLNNKRFEVTTTISRIHYEFDSNLSCTNVYLGDEFILNFNRLKKDGKLSIELSDIDIDKLRSEILYWDSGVWSTRSVPAYLVPNFCP